jgi:hypothetical protein
MGFYDAFFGTDQSLYTAYAIIAAIIAICITILLTATDVSVGNRILIVLFVIVTLLPSIFLTLFELTCIVTGGTEPNRWWCYAFAWVLAAFIIIYCIFIVVISLISLFTYNSAIDNINDDEARNKLPAETSNNVAKEIITTQEVKQKEIEKFGASDVLSMFDNGNNNAKTSNFVDYGGSNVSDPQIPPPPNNNNNNNKRDNNTPGYFTNMSDANANANANGNSNAAKQPASNSPFTNMGGSSVEGFEGFGGFGETILTSISDNILSPSKAYSFLNIS